MYERFTDRARRCVHLAKQSAHELQHECVEPEHLLLGFLKEGRGVGMNVLRNMAVSLDALKRSTIVDLSSFPKGEQPVPVHETIPLSSASEELLGRLKDEVAAPFKHDYVDTAHLLLGLLQDQACGKLLRENGVAADMFTDELLREVSGVRFPYLPTWRR